MVRLPAALRPWASVGSHWPGAGYTTCGPQFPHLKRGIREVCVYEDNGVCVYEDNGICTHCTRIMCVCVQIKACI